jgi:hypothetical protein
MKDQNIMTHKDVVELYERLFENSTKKQVKNNLKLIHEVCGKIVAANASPSVPSVVKALANNGTILSSRSIYNRRSGQNPYPILIDAWIEVAQAKKLGIEARIHDSGRESLPHADIKSNNSNSFVTEDDLMKISDPVLRYKISVLYGQMNSLKKQNMALREMRELPVIQPEANVRGSIEQQGSSPETKLSSLDVEILSNFLDGQNGLFYFDDEGILYAAKGIRTHSSVSDPGFKDAIEKLLPTKHLN